MDIAVQLPHTGPFAAPQFVRDYCQAAEAAGFAGIWTVDHLVVPAHTESRYLLSSTPQVISGEAIRQVMGSNLEQNTTLAVAAAVTSRVQLGTAVAVLPHRHPVLNARQLATIDLFAGGRLVYGVGAGWLKEELEVMGATWARRGAQTDEHIKILRTVWAATDDVAFEGNFWTFPAMDPRPRPPRGTIPILIGGYSDAALNRVVRTGDGWVTARISPERFARMHAEVTARCQARGRDPASLQFVAWAASPRLRAETTEATRATAELVSELRRYARAGVTQLRVGGDVRSPADSIAWLEAFGKLVLPHTGW